MSRTAAASFQYDTNSSLYKPTEQVKQVKLQLPPAHPRQHYFITTLERQPEVRFVVGACGTKFGKALSLDTPIPTPSGWKKMADIKVGDYVFDESGAPTLVEFVTDPMYDHKCYEVVFTDGNVLVVDAGHLWETETHAARKAQARVRSSNGYTSYGPSVLTTEEIKKTLTVTVSGVERPNHSVVTCGPVEFKEQDLFVDPYVLGYWLGDGSRGSGTITCWDAQCAVDHLKAEFDKAGYEVLDTANPQSFQVTDLRGHLKDIDVLDNKHIPGEYLISSVDQRLALLQGLMDTDGTISKTGDCTFDNTNLSLADSVEYLANSLGIKTTRSERIGKIGDEEHKLCYRVHFTTDKPVFRLQRKLERIRAVTGKSGRRTIADIRDTPSVPVKCIRVASPRHLFLVGYAFIPTHNTYGSTIAMVKEAWNVKDSLNWWVSPTYKQAAMAFELIKNLLPEGAFKAYEADLVLDIISPNHKVHSTIEFKSGDNPDSLRGFGVKFFVMDEAARCPYQSYLSLFTTITQTEGKGFFISTPKGRGWFYDVYQKGVKSDDEDNPIYGPDHIDPFPEWFSVRLPTWTNPHVSVKAIQDMKSNLPEDDFQQEVAAEFMVESAGVFRGIGNCVRGVLQPPQIGHRYVMGVDLARLRDFTVITVVDQASQQVVHHERFNQLSWEVQYHRIIECAKKYNNAQVYMDATGVGDPVVEAIAKAGVRVVPYKISGSAAKQQLIDKLRVNIENGKISFPMLPMLIRELEAYEMEVSPSGTVKFSAPTGKHDDCVISLALANWGADSPPFVYRYNNLRGI